jgi:hypothetical protein
MLFKEEDTVAEEESLGTVDVWQMRHYSWPMLRILTRASVEQLELHHYLKTQLASGHWSVLRAVPHVEPDGKLSTHRFDLYGRSTHVA